MPTTYDLDRERIASEYAAGRDRGQRVAEADAERGAFDNGPEFLFSAATSPHDYERAYFLGAARRYRELTRPRLGYCAWCWCWGVDLDCTGPDGESVCDECRDNVKED